MTIRARWRVAPADPPRAHRLAQALGLHPVTGQLLLNRGVSREDEGRQFLTPRLEGLADPFALPDMARAVDRLRQAALRREPILVFGDSDVDGLTASVILYEALRGLGAAVRPRVSNRISDGYGVPMALVRQACRSGLRVVILVDCGTNQPEAVEALAAAGIDTIIVDHHAPLDRPARPLAMVNPYCGGGPGRELSSAGLAFKVAQALPSSGGDGAEAFLDLAALGLLADCSPLRGDTRAIVAAGLGRILESERPGLRRLCEDTETAAPTPEAVVRRLVPRLNASGRLGEASAAWRLLRREGRDDVERWLAQVEAAHATLRQLHRQVVGEAQEQVNRLHFRDQVVMVVSRSGWPQGLMGPVASQLAERYGRPAIAIAMRQHQGTGSARSIPAVNLLEVLRTCRELLVGFGGHAQACGLTLETRNMERFRALVNERAGRLLDREALVPTRTLDLELPLEGVSPGWVAQAERFAPFGQGNARPTVVVRGLEVTARSPRTGWVADGRRRIAARGRLPVPVAGGRYDVVATPGLDDGEVVLTLADARAATGP
jgi:single-stranded-DNA-specific exonuclease